MFHARAACDRRAHGQTTAYKTAPPVPRPFVVHSGKQVLASFGGPTVVEEFNCRVRNGRGVIKGYQLPASIR